MAHVWGLQYLVCVAASPLRKILRFGHQQDFNNVLHQLCDSWIFLKMFHLKDIATNAINNYNWLLYTKIVYTCDLIESTRTRWSPHAPTHMISLKTHGWSLTKTSLWIITIILIDFFSCVSGNWMIYGYNCREFVVGAELKL